MPEFVYSAKSGPHEIVRGNIQAATKLDAVRSIEQMGLVPVEVLPAETAFAAVPRVVKPPAAKAAAAVRRRLSTYEICVFARQLSSFMKSQTPLIRALEFIRKETPDASAMKPFLAGIVEDVHDGKRFSDALEARGASRFDARFISMVRAGEASGQLEEILAALADALEAEEEVRGQIRAAMAYPALVLTAGAATVLFLLTFAIPRLASLFNTAFTKLPLATKILLALGRPEWQAFIFGCFVLVSCAAVAAVFVWRKNRKMFDRMVMRLPLLGKLRVKADVARFCGALGSLVDSGVPIHDAIEVTRPVLANAVLEEELENAQARVVGGEMFTQVVRGLAHFPPFAAQMIAVGEDSGRLSDALREVSRFYTRESLRDIKTIASLIEPLLILGLGLVVGFIVAGIMLPIFSMDLGR